MDQNQGSRLAKVWGWTINKGYAQERATHDSIGTNMMRLLKKGATFLKGRQNMINDKDKHRVTTWHE